MAHPRKLIRQAVVALLVAANTAAGARVVGTRVEPHKKAQLPAISVYTLREPTASDAGDSAPRELTRELKLEITCWVAHSDTVPVDDAMDDIAEQVEAAMDADPYLGTLAADSVLEDTTMQVLEENGASDPLVGIVTLTYSITYRTSPAAPADLDDFLSVAQSTTTTDSIPGDTVPASDEFIVQEIAP